MTATARQLHPDWIALLAQFQAAGMPAFADLTPDQAREVVQAFADLQGQPEEVADVRDTEIPGPQGPIRVRIYTPAGTGAFGGIAYFHGGGFVTGTVDVADNACRAVANACGTVVVSVDYRLAPEYKFPVPLEDCYAAVAWMSQNAETLDVDPARLAVMGDSAGGNLAAAVALLARDRGGPALAAQILVYPVIAPPSVLEFESLRANAEGYLLTPTDMQWFWNHYLDDPSRATDPYAAPLFAENLAGLPPLLIVTAEFDALRDEGEAYARRLAEAGCFVSHHRFDDMTHGFLWMDGAISRYRDLITRIAEDTRPFLSGWAAK